MSLGWKLKNKSEYKINKVLCGNGFTVVIEVPLNTTTNYDFKYLKYESIKSEKEFQIQGGENHCRIETIGINKINSEKEN